MEDLVPGVSNTDATMSDVDLALMEARLREMLLALSQLKWATEAQAAFIDSIFPDNAPKEIQSIPNTMDTAMDFIFTFLLDAVSTLLSNIVLRRRDLILSQATRMRPDLAQ